MPLISMSPERPCASTAMARGTVTSRSSLTRSSSGAWSWFVRTTNRPSSVAITTGVAWFARSAFSRLQARTCLRPLTVI